MSFDRFEFSVDHSPLSRERWGFVVFDNWRVVLDFHMVETRPSTRHRKWDAYDPACWTRIISNHRFRGNLVPSVPEVISSRARSEFLAKVEREVTIKTDGSRL